MLCFTEIIIGFPHEELTLEASDVDDAIVLLFGEALQSFEIEYIQGTIHHNTLIHSYGIVEKAQETSSDTGSGL